MKRYAIPFAIGLMLGLGSVPMWAGSAASAQAETNPAPIVEVSG